MALKLFKAELPKGTGGRKPKELDAELRDALVDALKDRPVGENGRPVTVGHAARTFDTEGKSSADGRRYARFASEALETTVRCRVIETAEGSGKWGWVLYIPLASEQASGAQAGQGATDEA